MSKIYIDQSKINFVSNNTLNGYIISSNSNMILSPNNTNTSFILNSFNTTSNIHCNTLTATTFSSLHMSFSNLNLTSTSITNMFATSTTLPNTFATGMTVTNLKSNTVSRSLPSTVTLAGTTTLYQMVSPDAGLLYLFWSDGSALLYYSWVQGTSDAVYNQLGNTSTSNPITFSIITASGTIQATGTDGTIITINQIKVI